MATPRKKVAKKAGRGSSGGGARGRSAGGKPAPRVTRPVRPPLVGISCDMDAQRISVSRTYVASVSGAGAIPLLLCPVPGPGEPVDRAAARHADLCDAFILSGGDDPATESYGYPTHPKAKRVHPDRQRYEEALLAVLEEEYPDKPVLGICLGMQMMALTAGGELNQHLPDDTTTAADHADDTVHEIRSVSENGRLLLEGRVSSRHHQAVRDAGALEILAVAHDGVIEAIEDPERKFYVGVQWHPERTTAAELGGALFGALIGAVKKKR